MTSAAENIAETGARNSCARRAIASTETGGRAGCASATAAMSGRTFSAKHDARLDVRSNSQCQLCVPADDQKVKIALPLSLDVAAICRRLCKAGIAASSGIGVRTGFDRPSLRRARGLASMSRASPQSTISRVPRIVAARPEPAITSEDFNW